MSEINIDWLNQLAADFRQLQADHLALEDRVMKVEGELESRKRKEQIEDLQFRSAGG